MHKGQNRRYSVVVEGHVLSYLSRLEPRGCIILFAMLVATCSSCLLLYPCRLVSDSRTLLEGIRVGVSLVATATTVAPVSTMWVVA